MDKIQPTMKRIFRRGLKPESRSTPIAAGESRSTLAPTTSVPSSSPTKIARLSPFGIKELHGSPESVVDIVFIHGLTGDREQTWTANNILWPRELLPIKFPNIRVLTFGYDASASDWRNPISQNRVRDHSWSLLNSLATHREEDDTNERPIIFICHSLGGLVCEDALLISKDRPEKEKHYKNIARLTKSILFLGTPHHGSDLARWAHFVTRCLGLSNRVNPDIVQVLTKDSEVLARIQDSFHTMILERGKDELSAIEIICFYEELPYPGVGLIVPRESALIPGYVPIGIHSRHGDMGKFESNEDAGFIAICGVLRRTIKLLGTASTIKDEGSSGETQLQSNLRKGSSLLSLTETEKSCMSLLSASDVSDYISLLPKPVKGTCRWILSHPSFASWVSDNDTKLLWLTGHPGSGKTVLSYFLAKYLQPSAVIAESAQVCAYFCDDKVARQKDARSILQSIIYQIIRCHRSLVKYVKTVFEMQGPNLAGSFSSLWSIFLRIASDPKSGSIYIIVDAIDECGEATRRLFLEAIEELFSGSENMASLSQVKFFLTSRPTILGSLHTRPFLGSRMAIEELSQSRDEDLLLVIRHKINELGKICGYNDETKTYLEQTLYTKSGRTFLWLHMILETLQDSPFQSQKDIETIIAGLPSSLESTYERFLHYIPDTQRKNAARLLTLLIGSSRFLNTDEINFAFTISSEDDSEQAVWSRRQPSIDRTIREILGPLVRISESRVSLVHQSAKEFFLQLVFRPDNPFSDDFGMHPAMVARRIAAPCVYYLLLEEFDKDLFSLEHSPLNSTFDSSSSSSEEHFSTDMFSEYDPLSLEDAAIFQDTRILDKEISQALSERHFFLNYAALHWAEHYSLGENVVNPELKKAARRLLDPSEACCTNWLRYYLVEANINDEFPDHIDSVLLAAYFNMPQIVTELLQTDNNCSQQGKDRALFWAAKKGHIRVVQLLLEANADPNAPISDRQTAIMVAAQDGHPNAMKPLLEDVRTDVNAQSLSGRTALSFACRNGYLDAFQLLWEREDTNRDNPDKSGATPFILAVRGGHREIISAMLKGSGINVNHQDKTLRTAVSWAAGEGLEISMKMLLKNRNVDVNLKDKNGRSPFLWAADKGHVRTFEALLRNRRVDKSIADKDLRNAISWACGSGHETILQMLIQFKCPGLDTVDIDGWSPLTWAVQTQKPALVELLVSTGEVNIERRDKSGRTALSWAVEYGHRKVVEAVIAAGADIRTIDDRGRSLNDIAQAFSRDGLLDLILREPKIG